MASLVTLSVLPMLNSISLRAVYAIRISNGLIKLEDVLLNLLVLLTQGRLMESVSVIKALDGVL